MLMIILILHNICKRIFNFAYLQSHIPAVVDQLYVEYHLSSLSLLLLEIAQKCSILFQVLLKLGLIFERFLFQYVSCYALKRKGGINWLSYYVIHNQCLSKLKPVETFRYFYLEGGHQVDSEHLLLSIVQYEKVETNTNSCHADSRNCMLALAGIRRN